MSELLTDSLLEKIKTDPVPPLKTKEVHVSIIYTYLQFTNKNIFEI